MILPLGSSNQLETPIPTLYESRVFHGQFGVAGSIADAERVD